MWIGSDTDEDPTDFTGKIAKKPEQKRAEQNGTSSTWRMKKGKSKTRPFPL